MGGYSIELCGGTHVSNTGSIASFKIVSESGIAAGTRRIEAITASNVIAYYKTIENELHEAARAAKAEPANLAAKIEALTAELKAANAENEKLKAKLADASLGDVLSDVTEVAGIKVLAANVPNLDMNGLRNFCDKMKAKLSDCVVVLASVIDGKVNLVAAASDSAMAKGAHAGNLIKEIASLVGGGGGGRSGFTAFLRFVRKVLTSTDFVVQFDMASFPTDRIDVDSDMRRQVVFGKAGENSCRVLS